MRDSLRLRKSLPASEFIAKNTFGTFASSKLPEVRF